MLWRVFQGLVPPLVCEDLQIGRAAARLHHSLEHLKELAHHGLALDLGCPGACLLDLAPAALASSGFLIRNTYLKDLWGIRRDPKTARTTRTSPSVGRLALPGLSVESAGVSVRVMGPLTAMKRPSSEPVSTMVPTPLFSVILDRIVPQIAQHAPAERRQAGRLQPLTGVAISTRHCARQLLPEDAYTGARLAAWISSNFASRLRRQPADSEQPGAAAAIPRRSGLPHLAVRLPLQALQRRPHARPELRLRHTSSFG